MKHKKKTKANKASLYEMMRNGGKVTPKGRKAGAPKRPAAKLGSYEGPTPKTREQLEAKRAEEKRKRLLKVKKKPTMKKGGKLYEKGGVNDPTRKAERRKALLNELRIANDPKTNYGSEQARAKDVATIQAKIKALG
tara:strand:+ start:761 stop:1171 length:411 start_codon:yes stop_codon:yes gene_type:complete